MKDYNSPFFGLFENWFMCLKDEYGEKIALKLFKKVMEKGLSGAYGEDF